MLVITDRFSKFVRSISLQTTTATIVSDAFMDHFMFLYGAPEYVLTDIGKWFFSMFFDAVCVMMGNQNYLTTVYHLYTSGQDERFNKTIVQRLRRYVKEHQKNWDICCQPFTPHVCLKPSSPPFNGNDFLRSGPIKIYVGFDGDRSDSPKKRRRCGREHGARTV